MDFSQLEVFSAVAAALHFGRAAEQLHLAQPYLSRTIRALEADLGAPLFDRTTRRVELTPAGRALLEPAAALLRMAEQARSDVEAAHRGAGGRVRISFGGPSSLGMVGTLARTARERYPQLDLAVRPGRFGTTAIRELMERSTDLAIARFAHPPPGVASRAVVTETGIFAVPSDHPLAQAGSVSFSALRDEPFITLPESVGSAVRAMFVARCQAEGFAPDIVQTAPDSWTCVALVAAGVGLHFTTESGLRQMTLDGVTAVPLADELPPVYGYLLWRAGDRDPALARVLELSEQVLPTVA
jgi:DNA-binding transcriptional LysR family regulator